MALVQDIPSNGNDLVDSLDRLKVDDGEPRLGRVATMEKINHNGLANGKTMGYSVRRGSFFTSSNMSHEFVSFNRSARSITRVHSYPFRAFLCFRS